jgi:hypothetical protein
MNKYLNYLSMSRVREERYLTFLTENVTICCSIANSMAVYTLHPKHNQRGKTIPLTRERPVSKKKFLILYLYCRRVL